MLDICEISLVKVLCKNVYLYIKSKEILEELHEKNDILRKLKNNENQKCVLLVQKIKQEEDFRAAIYEDAVIKVQNWNNVPVE